MRSLTQAKLPFQMSDRNVYGKLVPVQGSCMQMCPTLNQSPVIALTIGYVHCSASALCRVHPAQEIWIESLSEATAMQMHVKLQELQARDPSLCKQQSFGSS